MKTCGQCDHFELCGEGAREGWCYGVPPAVYTSGMQQVNPPKVKPNRRYCHMFTPLPDGVPMHVWKKVDPDTVQDARRLAAEEKAVSGSNGSVNHTVAPAANPGAARPVVEAPVAAPKQPELVKPVVLPDYPRRGRKPKWS